MPASCYDYSLKYLSRYPKTVYEFDLQLQKKGYEEEERMPTIDKLKEIGFLDDARYAEQYLLSEVVRKGKPLFVIQQKLKHKGIDKDTLSLLVEEIEEDLQEGQRKKITKEMQKFLDKGLSVQDAIKKLQTRGYTWNLLQELLDK